MKIILKIVFFIVLLTQTSCFELIEETSLQTDGSGSLKVTLNMSQSKTKIASLMKLDSVDGHKIPKEQDIRKRAEEVKNKLLGMDGIKDVQMSFDFKEYIFTATCQFSDAKKLDNAIVAVIKHYDKQKNDIPENNFYYKNKILYRNAEKILEKIVLKDDKLKESFGQAFYTAIYRMPKPVVTVKNSEYKISKNKMAAMLKLSVWDIISKKKNISVEIKHE